MEFWRTFTGGLLTAFLVELVMMLFAFIFVKAKNSSLLKAFSASRIFGHGIEYAYKDQNEALDDIKKDIKISDNISIFCIRGRSYIQQDEELSYVLDSHKNIRFLLSNPDNPYVIKRAAELNMTAEDYKTQLRVNLRELIRNSHEKNYIQKKVHNEPPVFRILILDNRLYFSYFKEHKMGSKLPVFRAKYSSEIYVGFKRYFDYHWDNSQDMPANI